MYTLALASRAVVDWAGGNPAAVVSYGARFTRPVVVPVDDDGTTIEVTGAVKSVDDDGATIEITVTNDGQKVLGQCRAVIRC
jgi:acyl dehydratase